MSKPMTVKEFFAAFPNDETCLEHLMKTRYGKQCDCPKCGRYSKFYRMKAERAYACEFCGHHIHPTADTPMHRSRTSLQSWFYVMHLFTSSRHGVSGKEIQRSLGCTYKTAWRMGHEIRKYMALIDGDGPLDGDVEADETYVGGKRSGKRGRGAGGKTVVFAMQDRDGDIMSKVVPDASRQTLHTEIKNNVKTGSTLHTDEWPSYRTIDQHGYTHKTCDHGAKIYARDGSHVNTVEAFFGILKRSIRSTHIWVSKKHMPKYLAEFEFRHNLRGRPDLMFQRLLMGFR